DKYRTGKLTPEGEPDPSVFSTEFNPEGIQVGTAVAVLVRKAARAISFSDGLRFRNFWGKNKRQQLLESAAGAPGDSYRQLKPALDLGLPFMPAEVATGYLGWPLLPEILPWSSPGVNTSRDLDLVGIDLTKLRERIPAYFDSTLSDQQIKALLPSLTSARYNPVATRRYLLDRGEGSGYFVRYCYRPFDVRFVYWHPETKLIDEKREDLFSAVKAGNVFLTSRQKAERLEEGSPFYVAGCLA